MKSGFLPVEHGHVLYWEKHGVADGIPAVILHGGPGGGLQHSHLKFFNLKKFCVYLFDQRGCGKSTPFGSLDHNTTWDLVEDIERLRREFSVEAWYVYGGSWGTTLGLAYAETYPKSVLALLLRSVCLTSEEKLDWMYEPGGASEFFPEEYAAFRRPIKGTRGKTIKAYRKLLLNARTRKTAAKAWDTWEGAISYLVPRDESRKDSEVIAVSLIENHYFSHNGWLKPNQLLDGAHKLTMPVTIVHGRYDLLCPVSVSFEFKKRIPHATLRVVPNAGHLGSEKGTTVALRSATDQFAAKV